MGCNPPKDVKIDSICCGGSTACGGFSSSVPFITTPTLLLVSFPNLAALQGDVLHVYAPGEETRDKLERWNNRLPALTYTWGGATMIADSPMAQLMSRGKCQVHSGWFRFSAAADLVHNANYSAHGRFPLCIRRDVHGTFNHLIYTDVQYVTGIAEDGKQIEIHDEPLHESICHTR